MLYSGIFSCLYIVYRISCIVYRIADRFQPLTFADNLVYERKPFAIQML